MQETSDFQYRIDLFKKKRLAILKDEHADGSRAALLAPAFEITSENVNLAIKLTGNNLFVALSPERTSSFLLSPMSRPSTIVGLRRAAYDTNICISVEAREGVSTGISASDRAATIRVLGEEQPNPRKLVKPGHIFPIEVREGGVLVNHALPEGALDIVKHAGFTDAALFSDLLNSAGEFCNNEETSKIALENNLPVFGLGEITQHRLSSEVLISKMAEAKLPTKSAGELRAVIYKSKIHEGEHLALVKGTPDPASPTLTRIQLEHTFADVFGGNNPPTRSQILKSLEKLGKSRNGVLVYLRRPLRGMLKSQVTDWKNYQQHLPASMIREYGIGSQILRDLGVKKIELLTNSPRDYSGVKSFGIEIVSQIQLDQS